MVYVTPACSLGLYTGFSTLLYQVVQTWMLVLEFVAGSTGVLELLVAIILYGLIPKSASLRSHPLRGDSCQWLQPCAGLVQTIWC